MERVTGTEVTKAQALNMLALTTMRNFTKEDWYCFAGCESQSPLIGEFANEYTIVLDGGTLLILHRDDEYGGQTFELKQVSA